MSRIPGSQNGALSVRHRPTVRDTAKTAVVALANPDTAVDLLRTAKLLLGGDGRLVACVVQVDEQEAEERREVVSGLRDLVDTLSDRFAGIELELQTTMAPSVARGVLDTIRDTGADTFLMGATTDEDDNLTVGGIGNSILDVVPCDAFVLGMPEGQDLDSLRRVVVAVPESAVARTAVRVGVLASQGLGLPLEVVHVLGGADRGAAWMRGVIADVDGAGSAVLTTVPAGSVDEGLIAHTHDDDLLIVGYEHGKEGKGWAAGSTARRVLARHDVSVLTVARNPTPGTERAQFIRRALAWLHPRLTDVEQDSVRDMAAGAAEPRLDFMLMTLLSGAIAALGLLLDSVAIIIGAMLVAPLMAPIQAFGIAVVDGRTPIATRAALTVAIGSALAIVASFLLGLVSGGELTDEIAARGAPSLLDAGVALAAGMAGAYATARKTIPAALAGVAIAAALVPPLGVVGLAAALGHWGLALGALLLFTVNIVCIAVTTAGVFGWLGLEAFDPAERRSAGPRYLMGAVLVLVLALALSVALRGDPGTLDAAELAGVVEDRSQGRAAFIDTIETETPDGDRVIRVLVDVAAVDGPGAAALEQTLLRAVEDRVTSQLGEDVEVRLILLDSVAATSPP